MSGGREPCHVGPGFGQDYRGGGGADPRDFIQTFRRYRERGQLHLDLFIDRGDIGIDAVDAGQHPGQQEGVVVIKVAGERLLECRDLRSHARPCQLGEHCWVAFAGDEGCRHLPPGDPENVRGHNGELDTGVLEKFSTRFFSSVRVPTRSIRYRVRSRSRRDETGPEHLPFGDFAQPNRIEHIGLRPPRQMPASRALTSDGSSPWASRR